MATPEDAAKCAIEGPSGATYQEAVVGMGMGRMLAALSGTYMSNAGSVYDQLMAQLRSKKSKTWREGMDNEFKDIPKIK